MARLHAAFFLPFAFIVIASCISIDSERLTAKLSGRGFGRSFLGAKDDKKPVKDDFAYVVSSRTNVPCTLANMTINVAIPTGKGDERKTLTVPRDAKATGTCSRVISDMKLTWKGPDQDAKENSVTFRFLNDHSDFSVLSIDVDIFLDKTYFKDSKEERFKATSDVDLRLFAASATNGIHRCGRETKRKVGSAEIIIKDVSLIAFNADKDVSSRVDSKCAEADDQTALKSFPLLATNDQKDVCVLARMSISLGITYETKNSESKRVEIKVPSDVEVQGTCDAGKTKAAIQLSWTESSEKSRAGSTIEENTIEIRFEKDTANAFIGEMHLLILLDEKNFADAKNVGKVVRAKTALKEQLFRTPLKNGLYSCADTTLLKLNEVDVMISDVLLVQFDATKEFPAKKVTECGNWLSVEDFSYVVRGEENGIPCTLANMSITITVPYKKGNENATGTLEVPKTAKPSGTCNEKDPTLKLTWSVEENKENTLTFLIGRSRTDSFIYRIISSLHLDEKNFPGVTDKTKVGTSDIVALFPSSRTNGLHNCSDSAQEIQADDIGLIIKDVVFIAFNDQEDLNAKEVTTCSKDTTSTTTSTTTTTTTTEPSLPTEPTESSTLSTTEVSSTSSTTEPTTTPEPDPSVKEYNYVVTNPETHVACILANMSISMKIPYETKQSATKETILKVPATAKTSGKCGDASSTMVLTWSEENSEGENTVALTFKAGESRSFLSSVNLNIYLDEKRFPDAAGKTYEATAESLGFFYAWAKNLYKCEPETTVEAKEARVTISHVALIAFNTEKSVASRSVENCVADEEPGANVGAIVGGVIGCLIAVSAIGYLYYMYRKRRSFA